MSSDEHTDLQSLRVKNPYLEMPVLRTPEHFRPSRIPTPPATEKPVVGSHLSSLRKRRVSGHISGSDVEVRCDKQGVVTDSSGVGRRRVVADFTSHDSLSLGGAVKKSNTLFAPVVSPLIVHVAGQGGDFDAPGGLVIDPRLFCDGR